MRRQLLLISAFSPRLSLAQAAFWTLLAVLLAFPHLLIAQSTEDATLYEVTDVAADVTSSSSAHARDEAVANAQRSAFEQLLGRLGVDTSLAAKLSDEDLATLVKNFEVQNERTSAVRYIGVFTVHFRPLATRAWLTQNGAHFTETRSKTQLILPILLSGGHPLLWEEHTKWWSAWELARAPGLVPIVLPSGGLDDIKTLSTDEAMSGDGDAIKALSDKYDAGGAAIVLLEGDLDNPGSPFKITVTRYDDSGNASEPIHLTLPAVTDKSQIDPLLQQGVKQSRQALEDSWRKVLARATQAPGQKLPVVVPIETLDQWNQIKAKLGSIHEIDHVNVLMLAKGTTNIELEFHSTIEQLQADLLQQNLGLTQDSSNSIWILQMSPSQSRL